MFLKEFIKINLQTVEIAVLNAKISQGGLMELKCLCCDKNCQKKSLMKT